LAAELAAIGPKLLDQLLIECLDVGRDRWPSWPRRLVAHTMKLSLICPQAITLDIRLPRCHRRLESNWAPGLTARALRRCLPGGRGKWATASGRLLAAIPMWATTISGRGRCRGDSFLVLRPAPQPQWPQRHCGLQRAPKRTGVIRRRSPVDSLLAF